MLIHTLILILITESLNAENKFMSTVRNYTNNNDNQRTRNNTDDNVLKNEIAKYLNECKSDAMDNFSYETEQSYGNRRYTDKNDGSSGTYPDYYGDKPIYNRNDRNQRNSGNSRKNDNGNMDGYLTNYGNQNDQKNGCQDNTRNNNRKNNDNKNHNNKFNNRNGRDEGNIELSFPQSSNRNNPYDTNNPNYGNGQNYNRYPTTYRTRDYETFNLGGGMKYGGGNNNPYNVRWKRESDNCISQCILGYLELLDENNTPSETATIKFIQDHMQNDRKRLKFVRDTRRCFAKMATSENEDGCALSKTLTKCLKLAVE